MSVANDNLGVEIAMAHIAILVYPGAQTAATLGMTDLFRVASDLATRRKGRAVGPSLFVSHWRAAGLGLTPERVFISGGDESEPPTVCVLPPSLEGPPTRDDPATTEWLLSLHNNGTTLASVCTGAFVLGPTGLFDGRAVTTHWTYEESFAARFPEAQVDTDRLILDEDDIITAGGLMAWTDLSLVLVDRYLGPEVMIEVARTFLLDPPGREQSYYSGFSPRLDHQDAAVLKVQDWLRNTDAKTVDLAALSLQAGLEERTLLRRFRKATGMTTTEYWQRLRVARARNLLQKGAMTVDEIAWEVGYADPSAFRKVFSRVVGLTPAEYRDRFRGWRRRTNLNAARAS